MPVAVERHHNGAVPEQALHDFGRQLTPAVRFAVDAPGRKEMPEGMQPVFRFASLGHHAGRGHHRIETLQHASMTHDGPRLCREHEIQLTLRASKLPHLERRHGLGRKRDSSRARCRLGRADDVVAIRALAHVQLAGFEINIRPASLISAGVGMSWPASSLRSERLFLPTDTPAATCAYLATLSSDLRLVITLRAIGRDRFASRSSRNPSPASDARACTAQA